LFAVSEMMAGHGSILREYRKGNWTVHETMILITAKKMDEERRMKRTTEDSEGRSRPAELRWKWIEDYCWSNGCLRSQNQCNDKWDNLMRDYKKVRDYESKIAEIGNGDVGSYWKLEKHERKDRNLPTNMLSQIYEALVDVVEKRGVQKLCGGSASIMSYVLERPMTSVQLSLPPLLPHHTSDPTTALAPPLPLPPCPPHSQQLLILVLIFLILYFTRLEICDSSDSYTTEYPDSPAKRRKRGEGNSTDSNSNEQGLDSAISRGATIIAEAIQSCEEKEEKRHREYLSVQERKLKMEESKVENDKEAVSGLVHAINGLATSIFALVSDKIPKASK
ncbi:hypothetical protein IFM89_004436, partial [Coptis chinensis]